MDSAQRIMITCPVCLTSNVDNTFFCEECGYYLLEDSESRETELYDLRTIPGQAASPVEVQADAASESPARPVAVYLEIGDTSRVIDMPDQRGACLGRLDPAAGFFPEVDLTEMGCDSKSVSRRHAQLASLDGRLVIEDLGSANGTYVNGKRLEPYAPASLEDGDTLHLGKLEVVVRML
jgi:hypothetical protein